MSVLELAPPHEYDIAADTAALQNLHLGYLIVAGAVEEAQSDGAQLTKEPIIEVGDGLDWSYVLTGVTQQVTERSEWWHPAPMTTSEAKACMGAIVRRQEEIRENLLTSLAVLTKKPVTVRALRDVMPDHFTQESFNNDPNVVPTVATKKVSGELVDIDWGAGATEDVPIAIVVGPDEQGVLTLWRIPFFDDSKRVAVSIREFDASRD